MTADDLRAAIARDCPHRLADYDRHLRVLRNRWNGPTTAFLVLWRIEHHISSDPTLEARLNELHQQAADTATRAEAMPLFEEASRIRAQIRDDVIKEMSDG